MTNDQRNLSGAVLISIGFNGPLRGLFTVYLHESGILKNWTCNFSKCKSNIYIYTFGRHFYLKRLSFHLTLCICFTQSLGLNPWPCLCYVNHWATGKLCAHIKVQVFDPRRHKNNNYLSIGRVWEAHTSQIIGRKILGGYTVLAEVAFLSHLSGVSSPLTLKSSHHGHGGSLQLQCHRLSAMEAVRDLPVTTALPWHPVLSWPGSPGYCHLCGASASSTRSIEITHLFHHHCMVLFAFAKS